MVGKGEKKKGRGSVKIEMKMYVKLITNIRNTLRRSTSQTSRGSRVHSYFWGLGHAGWKRVSF